jgi:hypothetical protein
VKEDGDWYIELRIISSKNKKRKVKPLIRFPRMKIQYDSKRFSTEATFCVSFFDMDIDDEIEEIYNFVRMTENKFGTEYKNKKKDWNMSFKKCSIRSAITTKNLSTYMKLAIYDDSVINDNNGNKKTIKDIKFGFYADQYVEMNGFNITKEGKVFPKWITHQLIISEHEKIFLEKSLLDEIYPDAKKTGMPVPVPMLRPPSIVSPRTRSKEKAKSKPKNAMPMIGFGVTPELLASVKLKKVP